MDIRTVRQRSTLQPRREPYWASIGTGQHVGFRRLEDGGFWIARAYDSGTRRRGYRALGDLKAVPDADRFTAAVREARKWFDHVERGGRTEVVTVGDAFLRYVENQAERKGATAAADARSRYGRHVQHDPIAGIELSKLVPRHLEAWRQRIAGRPALEAKRLPGSKLKTPAAAPRPRAPSTLKRDLVSMRAALNLALMDGFVGSDMAWRSSLSPPKGFQQQRREAYLTKQQRRDVLGELQDPAFADFVRVLCLVPLRPGALAAALVADFDSRHGTLTIRSDKARAGRKIPLPPDVTKILRAGARSKLPGAYLFTRSDGKPWSKNEWRRPFRDACERAELDPEVTLYTLRHSTITDLVSGGFDVVSVAEISGTSVDMIQKHYAHLQADRARAALSVLSL